MWLVIGGLIMVVGSFVSWIVALDDMDPTSRDRALSIMAFSVALGLMAAGAHFIHDGRMVLHNAAP